MGLLNSLQPNQYSCYFFSIYPEARFEQFKQRDGHLKEGALSTGFISRPLQSLCSEITLWDVSTLFLGIIRK